MSFFAADAAIDAALQYVIDNASLTIIACSGDPETAEEVVAQQIAAATVTAFTIADDDSGRRLIIPAASYTATAAGDADSLCIVNASDGSIILKAPIMAAGVNFAAIGSIVALAQSYWAIYDPSVTA